MCAALTNDEVCEALLFPLPVFAAICWTQLFTADWQPAHFLAQCYETQGVLYWLFILTVLILTSSESVLNTHHCLFLCLDIKQFMYVLFHLGNDIFKDKCINESWSVTVMLLLASERSIFFPQDQKNIFKLNFRNSLTLFSLTHRLSCRSPVTS